MHGYRRAQLDARQRYRTFEFPPAASQDGGTDSPQDGGTDSPQEAGTNRPHEAGGESPQQAGANSPLERTADLFGDGSLTLAFTPGHTHGHTSLVARLRARPALIAGDAIYTMKTLRDGARPWLSEDAAAFERSVAQLAAWDRANPGALIIPGHDMPAWRELDELYA
jgi:glyoxylase-like metal-dependent hydrolase (beta-lactamase superfamily II)